MLDRLGTAEGDASQEYSRQKRERQKLIVRTKKGDVYYGMCFALNKNAQSFHLDLQDKSGRPLNSTKHIMFSAIKAVFYVKSFDGRFNPEERQEMVMSRHAPVAITFEDEEVLIGRPVHATWRDEPRFFVVPEGQDTNNLMMLVERSAVKTIQDFETYKKKRNQEFTEFLKKHRKPGMSKEECIGDFYFSKHDYKNALRHYRNARESEELTASLKKKLCAAKYNLAMRHIKQKDYKKALRLMEMALEIDPNHEKTLHKIKQLRAHIAKKRSELGSSTRSGTSFSSSSESSPDFEEHNPLL